MDDIFQTLGRIEAKLESVDDKLDLQSKVDNDLHALHIALAARVDRIERHNIRVGGFVAGVVFLLGLVGGAALGGLSSLGSILTKL